MRFPLTLLACFSVILTAGCSPNTGHTLSFPDLPKQVSWQADTPLTFKLQAPSSWQPLNWRLRQPRLTFATTADFRTPTTRPCDREALTASELVIHCNLPTRGMSPGTTVYYRLEYTFDGTREGAIGSVNQLEVIANCPGNRWWIQGKEFGCQE